MGMDVYELCCFISVFLAFLRVFVFQKSTNLVIAGLRNPAELENLGLSFPHN